MSFWIERKEHGRTILILGGGGDLLLPMMLLGLVCSVGLFSLQPAVLLTTIGFCCFLAAKISLFRRGTWFSWGSASMTRGYARLYKTGYALMGLGALLSLAFMKMSR